MAVIQNTKAIGGRAIKPMPFKQRQRARQLEAELQNALDAAPRVERGLHGEFLRPADFEAPAIINVFASEFSRTTTMSSVTSGPMPSPG